MSIIKYTEEEFIHRKLLGKRIVELRHQKNLTQEELADKINIAVRSLSEIENGKCAPNAIIVYRIARALNIPLFEFYTFKEEDKIFVK
ncbi:MAG: helix-turn-helix transcriptional regulator [Roseburia sp.]|nr:helix-turn-helix transcriptional regulator [Anaeroplasma bactoclasticum]MCM1197081.1 helix-turn-helix transcriptional regulator [Roseburia sp.]